MGPRTRSWSGSWPRSWASLEGESSSSKEKGPRRRSWKCHWKSTRSGRGWGCDIIITPGERLDMILEVVEELEHMSGGAPIVVEGLKDVEALKRMGIKRNVVSLGKGLTVFAFCERMALRSGSAVIMTDWDRKGGKLARMLKDAL